LVVVMLVRVLRLGIEVSENVPEKNCQPSNQARAILIISVSFDYWFCCCPHCKTVGIEFNGRADRIGRCKCPKSAHGDKGYNHDDSFLVRAYHAAANAFRF